MVFGNEGQEQFGEEVIQLPKEEDMLEEDNNILLNNILLKFDKVKLKSSKLKTLLLLVALRVNRIWSLEKSKSEKVQLKANSEGNGQSHERIWRQGDGKS